MGRLEQIMQRKVVRVPLFVFLLCLSTYCLFGLIDMARRGATRNVMLELIAIGQAMEKSPPGIAKAEHFLRRVKAVDTRLLPAEVKAALQDYITAFASSMEAAKAGRDFTEYDLACAYAKQRLAECFEKYKL